jgi:hypothetical protein
MKKTITLLILAFILFSCGPKRAKCYGKRCVETTIKKEKSNPSNQNS